MNKLFFGLFLVLLVTAAIITFGCDNGNTDETHFPSIGVILFGGENYSDAIQVKNTIDKKSNGLALVEYAFSNEDPNTQNSQIDNFINNKVDVLAISLCNGNNTTSSITAILTKAQNAGIPVVFFLQGLFDQFDIGPWPKAYTVMADQNEIAAMQGEILADYWNSHGEMDRNNDSKMQYIMVHGPKEQPDALIRIVKPIEMIESKGINVECLSEFNGEWYFDSSRKESFKILLENYKETAEAIICGNDSMALGVIDVLNEIPYFDSFYIPIVGVDGEADAITAINNGKMLGTVFQDFNKIGEATFAVCYALGIGKNIPASIDWNINERSIIIRPTIITQN